MEIDFLGLNSSCKNEEKGANHRGSFVDSANDDGLDISLSLGATSSLDFQIRNLNLHEKEKKRWDFSCDDTKMILSPSSLKDLNKANASKADQTGLVFQNQPVFLHPSITAGFSYQPNNPWVNLSRMDLYSVQANNDTARAKASSSGLSLESTKGSRGHIPTVAMARRATLARFLKKRSHRMNQASSFYVMGKPEQLTKSKANGVSPIRSGDGFL